MITTIALTLMLLHTQPTIEPITYTVTAYTLRAEECGKQPTHPNYGITASGEKAQVGVTVAAGPDIPLGTRIYLPELEWLNGTGEFIVQDRGGGITEGRLDVYMGDPQRDKKAVSRARAFGRQEMEGILR